MASKFARSFCNRNNMGNNKANDDFISSKNNEWIETNNKNGLGLYSKKNLRKYNSAYEISLGIMH